MRGERESERECERERVREREREREGRERERVRGERERESERGERGRESVVRKCACGGPWHVCVRVAGVQEQYQMVLTKGEKNHCRGLGNETAKSCFCFFIGMLRRNPQTS